MADKPKATGHKGAFTFRQPIAGILTFVSEHEFAIDQQFVLDRAKRSLDAWVSRGKKSNTRNQWQTRIPAFRAVGLYKTFEIVIKAALAYFGTNFVGYLSPALARLIERFGLGHIRSAIERDPSHDLRMNEVLRSAADLPNTFVRLSPGFR